MTKLYLSILLGFLTGITVFIFFEGIKPSNSFYNTCWVRTQPIGTVHTKVYILGIILIWKGLSYSDIFLTFLGGSWIGLHLLQNIAEIYNESLS